MFVNSCRKKGEGDKQKKEFNILLLNSHLLFSCCIFPRIVMVSACYDTGKNPETHRSTAATFQPNEDLYQLRFVAKYRPAPLATRASAFTARTNSFILLPPLIFCDPVFRFDALFWQNHYYIHCTTSKSKNQPF